MKLPFHLIIEYAKRTNPDLVQFAYNEFFSSTGFPTEEQEQNAWVLLQKHDQKPTPTPPKVSKQEILKKRKELEIVYQGLTKEITGCMSFSELIKLIYEEDVRPPLDVWDRIMKKGLPNKIFMENIQLFNDIWNFFPHRSLGNECPVGLYNKFTGKK